VFDIFHQFIFLLNTHFYLLFPSAEIEVLEQRRSVAQLLYVVKISIAPN